MRHDGLVNYRATEVPTCSRFLTLLALYHSYSADAELLLKHFEKARALANWLLYRRKIALAFDTDDPRFGIPLGDDEADSYAHKGGFSGRTNPGAPASWLGMEPRLHHLSSAAEMYRGFWEMGQTWLQVGGAAARDDVVQHAQQLLAAAPLLLRDLHASLNRTLSVTAAGARCWAHSAEPGCGGWHTRTFPEMMYSGALSDGQIDDIYRMGTGTADCSGARNCSSGARFLQVGCPAGGSLIFTHIPFGLAFGMLLADFPDRFLLHYYAASAHSYTRGSWTVPESTSIDRDAASIAYNTAGQAIAPIYLRWMIAFEDPRSQTLWVGKATPREWLAPGTDAIEAQNVPTRYGRFGVQLKASQADGGAYTVHASLTLPAGFAPPGGVRLRVRAPLHAGAISSVSVGGAAWAAFTAKDETIDFAQHALAPSLLGRVKDIVVTFR